MLFYLLRSVLRVRLSADEAGAEEFDGNAESRQCVSGERRVRRWRVSEFRLLSIQTLGDIAAAKVRKNTNRREIASRIAWQ